MDRSVGLLRVRPGSQDRQGLSQKQLERIVCEYGEAHSPRLNVVSIDEFVLPGSQFSPDTQDKLDFTMNSMIEAYDLILIDQTYDLADARDPLSDFPLSEAMMFALESCDNHDKSVIVLRTELPQPGDALHYLFESGEYGDCLSFVASGGETHLGRIDSAFAQYLSQESAKYLERQDDPSLPFLRRRGVFRLSGGASPFFMFHYDLKADRREDLEARLVAYLAEFRVSLVIYNSRHAAPWYDDIVGKVCDNPNDDLARFDLAHGTSDFQPRASGDSLKQICERAARLWADQSKVTCFLVPAYHKGSTLQELRSSFGPRAGDVRQTAVLLDSEIDVEDCHQLSSGATSGRAPYKLEALDVDFFYRSRIPQLNDAGWKVVAAEALGEVTNPEDVGEHWDGRVPSGDVGKVALWSLFENYACGLEEPVPERRNAVRYFPKLRDMDDLDAHWLAEVCVKRFDELLEELGKSTKDVLVVLPKESDVESGAQPISRAMTDHCNVKTLEVPRAVIDGTQSAGDEVVKILRAYREYGFVVFDESTITGETLHKLRMIVESQCQRTPLAYGTVIDLRPPVPHFNESPFSLQRWHPLREVAR